MDKKELAVIRKSFRKQVNGTFKVNVSFASGRLAVNVVSGMPVPYPNEVAEEYRYFSVGKEYFHEGWGEDDLSKAVWYLLFSLYEDADATAFAHRCELSFHIGASPTNGYKVDK